MLFNSFLFLFSLIIIIGAIFVISTKNPIHSILFLILVFCGGSGILLLIGADFLAMVFLVVYVGAIAVLFLFVVMLLNIKIIELNTQIIQYLPLSLILFLIVLLEFIYMFNINIYLNLTLNFYDYYEWGKIFYTITLLESFGEVLYLYFFQFFLITSLLLLVAMIGPIVLTLNKSKYVLRQNIYEQNLRSWKKSINLVKNV